MKFGAMPLDQAQGAILAHAVRSGGVSFSKGRVLTEADITALGEAGVVSVVAAMLEREDVNEDEAAARIASSMAGTGFSARAPSTGRVNLHAERSGVFVVNAALVDRLNAVDPAITFATLRNHQSVSAGQMVATVKIIPFAVAQKLLVQAETVCSDGAIMAVHAFTPHVAALIQTTLGGTKISVLDKTARLTTTRLARSGGSIGVEQRTTHDAAALAKSIRSVIEGHDLVIVFGASATSDGDDVIPAAIRQAGGTVTHVGMPVDPGNLITLGELEGKPVIGAPGCARSPKENGFDWVLDRIVAGITVSARDIEGMGVGGLLAEIPARPRPRESVAIKAPPVLHAILLAAGRSSRMGGPNKLLATFDGVPLVRRIAETVLSSGLPLTVVTGHQHERIQSALHGIDANYVHNPDYADGLSGSLKTGIRGLPAAVDGAVVVLADMPCVTSADLRIMSEAFHTAGGGSVVRATHGGKRGNPVILPKNVFANIEEITGDTGARQVVEAGHVSVVDVEIGGAASLDVDTPERMREAGGTLPSRQH